MIEDPLTEWPGEFPYRVLADFGITPRSSQAEVKDVVFELMARDRMNPVTQRAADELRDPAVRLLADLLHYDLDPATVGPPEAFAEPPAGPPGLPAALVAFLSGELLGELGGEAPSAVFPSRPFLDGLVRFDC
ncbi:hypothetical protein [Amycolatopsis sp. NPDC004079]|uniref:hypothetical protein n=1 Tax=Amycolatopsis sp. NPDC004079 TaxID=3154549 RepID=UPI0033A34227